MKQLPMEPHLGQEIKYCQYPRTLLSTLLITDYLSPPKREPLENHLVCIFYAWHIYFFFSFSGHMCSIWKFPS